MADGEIFDELVEGMAGIKSHREGKLTLAHGVKSAPLADVESKLSKDARKKLR